MCNNSLRHELLYTVSSRVFCSPFRFDQRETLKLGLPKSGNRVGAHTFKSFAISGSLGLSNLGSMVKIEVLRFSSFLLLLVGIAISVWLSSK